MRFLSLRISTRSRFGRAISSLCRSERERRHDPARGRAPASTGDLVQDGSKSSHAAQLSHSDQPVNRNFPTRHRGRFLWFRCWCTAMLPAHHPGRKNHAPIALHHCRYTWDRNGLRQRQSPNPAFEHRAGQLSHGARNLLPPAPVSYQYGPCVQAVGRAQQFLPKRFRNIFDRAKDAGRIVGGNQDRGCFEHPGQFLRRRLTTMRAQGIPANLDRLAAFATNHIRSTLPPFAAILKRGPRVR